jgi:hypothetical protein
VDPTWLDRIGIILDFIAGFMIAPELIGLERIYRIEQATHRHGKSLRERVQRIIRHGPWTIRSYTISSALSIVGFFLTVVIIWAHITGMIHMVQGLETHHLVILLLASITGIVDSFFPRIRNEVLSTGGNIAEALSLIYDILAFLCYFVLVLPLACVLFLLETLWWLGIFAISWIMLRVMERQNGLRAYLVTTGIILFILGSLLQFLATFF